MEEESENKPQNGSILISEPYLGDPNFERTVVLICSHVEGEGTFGLVLNRQSNLKLSDVVDIYNDTFEAELGIGGPVQYNTLHYVHQIATLPQAVQLNDNLYWGGDFEALRTVSGTGEGTQAATNVIIGYYDLTSSQ